MQRIKKARMVVTLCAGAKKWDQGTIVPEKEGASLDPVLIAEVRANTGTVEVLEYYEDSQSLASEEEELEKKPPKKLLKRG